MWTKKGNGTGEDAKETTPLLRSQVHTTSDPKKHWARLRNVTQAGIAFRRTVPTRPRGSLLLGGPSRRASVRGSLAFPFFADDTVEDETQKELVEPCEALAPLVAGGKIKDSDGVVVGPRAPPLVKSIPAFAPYRRKQRHRSFYLWWTNEFRHWWKSSRLLVRLGGLDTHARDPIVWAKMVSINPLRFRSLKKMYKIIKRLGQGGPMRSFLQRCHPFTRSLRILVGAWRWVESAQCRRLEVGVEETMAFIGNRVSRMVARTVVDAITGYGIIPSSHFLYKRVGLSLDFWHPALICILMGILRACSPYGASFQGSRVGRVLTRRFFRDSRHNWLPLQRAEDVNLFSEDCCEGDEISENADLAKLAKVVAKALGMSQSIGVDGMAGQNENLAAEGFNQIGSGSGGYAVYECHRVVKHSGSEEDDVQTILLHLTPYGPSLLDVMPRYMVLEKEDAQDRRASWSEYLASKRWNGPSVVEGYAYQGAFFSPYHFAEMKERYGKQLLAYDAACAVMAKPRTGRKAGPPTDLPSLKVFLAHGKLPRKRHKNEREYNSLQKEVSRVARKLKGMMSTGKKGCTAPHGVILYFEGLDCSGKSSTGGLIEQALVQAGFDVDMRQYNRPPTEEQKKQSWMKRFAVPDTSQVADAREEDGTKPGGGECTGHRHTAMVWDRGPAGDFVYGALANASQEEKNERYREFMQFDADCMKNKILFVKLMFITNRDSIAGTLGKRLAQRKMSQDLRTWLKASYSDAPDTDVISMEGLDMIDLHIDPTDFIAFNRYQHNLRVFMNFALNTDTDANPWVVVNTTDRLSARKQLLDVFEGQIDAFARAQAGGSRSWCSGLLCPSGAEPEETTETPGITMSEMMDRKVKKGPNLSGTVALMALLILVFYYCENTTFGDNLNFFLDQYYGTEGKVKDKLPSDVP